jgi:hypothetical protein
MRHAPVILFTVLSCAAIAQTVDGINAPVSRTVTIAADEAAFTILAAASLDSTPQQVKQALQNAGLPNPTVVAIGLGQDSSRLPPNPAQMLYSATDTIAAGSAIDTANRLEALRTHLQTPLQSLQYSVAFNASQAKVDAMRQTVLPQLMDESRKLAQSLAVAAGIKLGAVRSISDSGGGGVYAYIGVARSGDFSSLLLGYPSALVPSGSQYTFYLNVVFAAAP